MTDEFESWPTQFEPPPHRVVDPPKPVTVNVAMIFAAAGGEPANSLPLRVLAEGLSTDVRVQGTLSGWARTNRGAWLAHVQFSIPTGNGQGRLDVDQWCPSSAVSPLE